jgi:hypothetical protein
MTIACQSALSVTDPVQVPGPVRFRITLQAGLTSTKARITFIIRDVDNCVTFANGRKMESADAMISTMGTTVVHETQLHASTGKAVPDLGFEARVTENGAFQCMQLTPVDVSRCDCIKAEGLMEALSTEVEEVVATLVRSPGKAKQGSRTKGAAKKGAAKKGAAKRSRGRNRGR